MRPYLLQLLAAIWLLLWLLPWLLPFPAQAQWLATIQATPTSSGGTITWTSSAPATGYMNIGRSTPYSVSSKLITSLNITHTAIASGLQPATLYHYQVCSSDVTGYKVCSLDHTFTTLPAAGQHMVGMNWVAPTAPPGMIAGYNVYRSTVSGGPYVKINSTLVTPVIYTDSTVQGSTTYYYVVTAVNVSSLESSYSNQATAIVPTTTGTVTVTVPTPPLPLTFNAASPPNAVEGSFYTYQFTADGGILPYTWSMTGAVPGMTLSTAGLFSGTPSHGSGTPSGCTSNCSITYPLAVTVRDSCTPGGGCRSSATATFTMR